MDLIITWTTILKLLLTALGTYVLLPIILILRDMLLWRFIDAFILNDDLHARIHMSATKIHTYNSKYLVPTNFTWTKGDDEPIFEINGEVVTKQNYDLFEKHRRYLQRQLNEDHEYIRRRSQLLQWLFRHYKQNGENPIPDWLEKAGKRIEKNQEEFQQRIAERDATKPPSSKKKKRAKPPARSTKARRGEAQSQKKGPS